MNDGHIVKYIGNYVKQDIIPYCTLGQFLLLNMGTLTGWYSYDILSNFMLVGEEGVYYYSEAHVSSWNAWIHTIGMPMSIYGMLFWIPAVLNLNGYNAKKFIWFIYYMYGGHYIRLNKLGALLYYLMYIYTVKRASNQYGLDIIDYNNNLILNTYYKSSREYLIKKGLYISCLGLLFQEIFGHWISEDITSRPEAIPNAILYAIYFSATHILY